ncbi:L-lactate MFS transporter [Coleofasciculus sp. G2-EDA-02]|uniref:L-lactate MFS transporter n=1 Tax=Coleofasciculus sp. G2-EDA-02 TaxID=3069529 RepID=UPI0032FFEBC4
MDNWQSIRLFGLPAEKGRWFLIPLGSMVLLCLGTVYSWSIFRKPLEDLFGISATQSVLPFTILLVLYAMLMPITGFYIDKIGVGKITAIGGVVTGIGYILSSLATNITLLTITYGVIAGAGVGIAYGVPLTVSAKWFPDRKGLAVGLTAIGFGLSPLVTAPLAKSLIAAYGVLPTFTILGISLTAIILVISMLLKLPPVGWKPQTGTAKGINEITKDKRRELLKSPSFYALWVCYTIGTFVGLSAIGISSPVAQEIIKLDATTAAITVSLFAVFNGIGRPLFGWLTDRLQPKGAAMISYVLILIASILMLNAGEGEALTYLVAFSLFWLCLGGWLAIAPTATLILFAPEDYAKNYGMVFTAYGAGALLGTLAIGQIRDLFGSYTYAFYPTGILAIIGIIIAQLKLD